MYAGGGELDSSDDVDSKPFAAYSVTAMTTHVGFMLVYMRWLIGGPLVIEAP